MSSLALMSWAESLATSIIALWESEPHKAFLISHKLEKIATDLKKKYQPQAISYWNDNKELPAWYICKETNRSSYCYEQDPTWQLLKSHLEAREAILKASSETQVDYYDTNGELVPKVQKKSTAIYTFSKK